MVGSIHPMSVSAGISACDLKYYPLTDLVWIVWDKFRRCKEHVAVCPVCQHVGDWYIPYNEFIYRLIYTNVYDEKMGAVSSADMASVEAFFFGYIPNCSFSFLDNYYFLIKVL